MKHTKGEWRALPMGFVNEGATKVVTLANNIKFVCNTFISHETVETAEANAKLIAAAPDLLEAAMQLLSWKGETPQHCREQLEKAIKKATL